MLTLTENASTIIKDISTQPGIPESAGLRIAAAGPDPSELSAQATDAAQPGDATVEQEGATVYLDPLAADLLDDKVLDASVDEAGRVEFALAVQG